MRSIAAASLLLVVFASGVCAQEKADISSPATAQPRSHDRPIGLIKLKVPAKAGSGSPIEDSLPPPPATETPASEGEDIPPSETPPEGPAPEEPPPFYGEPVSGKFTFVLDASGSMHGSKMASLRAEATSVINALSEEDELDACAFGTQFPPSEAYSKYLWQGLLPATEGNRSAAVSWINGPALNPGGGTPTHDALKKACLVYPSDLTKMFLVTDGYPNVSGGVSQILSNFPGWWSKFEETELVCVCIGGGGASFMQQLAAIAGGTYVAA
jgi:hypothetical protein